MMKNRVIFGHDKGSLCYNRGVSAIGDKGSSAFQVY